MIARFFSFQIFAVLLSITLVSVASAQNPNSQNPNSTAAPKQQPPQKLVRHGTLPTNPKYWDFQRWYLDHSVVHLVVNGENASQLLPVLEELQKLIKNDVAIGKVVVIGWPVPNLNEVQLLQQLPRALEILQLGSASGGGTSAEELLKTLSIENSPTWIVRYHGKNYIYEGVDSIARYFNRQGQFLDGGE